MIKILPFEGKSILISYCQRHEIRLYVRIFCFLFAFAVRKGFNRKERKGRKVETQSSDCAKKPQSYDCGSVRRTSAAANRLRLC